MRPVPYKRDGHLNPNWQGGPQLARCIRCGGEYRIKRHEFKRRKYCSQACHVRALSETKRMENSSQWRGGKTINCNGRPMRMAHGHPRASSNSYVFEHILVAEKALGKYLPSGAVVHHINRDVTDNVNRNLVICQNQAYHMLIHARMRILEAGGNPHSEKRCGVCKAIKAKTEFGVVRKSGDGKNSRCKDCCQIERDLRRAGTI